MRDLVQQDDGGWLQDPVLLDRLVVEKLTSEAEALRGEGWKWIEVAAEFPYGHTSGLRRVAGETASITDEEQASHDALRAEYDKLEETYAEAEELPDEVDQRFGEIETALEAFDERPVIYNPADIARAGAFVSIDGDGDLRIERGYVRPEDEAPAEPDADGEAPEGSEDDGDVQRTVITIGGNGSSAGPETAEEEDGIKPLPDRLVTELTAHRTLALRDALANDPDTALVAVLHALCLNGFYRYVSETCLEITAKSASFGTQAPGLNDSASAKAIEDRHAQWAGQMPKDAGDLWKALIAFDGDSRASLLAHCASLSVNAVHEPWNSNRSDERRVGKECVSTCRSRWAP